MDNKLLFKEKICVVGLGYIGLPTASLLATKGFDVLGVDVVRSVVDMIHDGEVPIYEPDLDVLVKAAVQSGKLHVTTEPQPSDVFILAVPTPFKEGHEPDLTYVESAVKSIAPVIAEGNLIILESTSPVGTTERIAEWLSKLRPDLHIPLRGHSYISEHKNRIFLAHCPERVLPGQILKELVDNDRIIGGIDLPSGEKTRALYQKFVKGDLLLTDSRTAEMSKLTENAFRDVNIAFANELSMICDQMDISVWDLIELANRHPRVNILQPGPGVGGHCIAVDPWFIVSSSPDTARLIKTAREVNDFKPQYVVEKIEERARRFKKPIIACLGLAFKANIDDLRESPAVKIVLELASSGNTILAVEPHIQALPPALREANTIQLVQMEEALIKSDIILLLVDHMQFRDIKKDMLYEKVVIDTRGMWR